MARQDPDPPEHLNQFGDILRRVFLGSSRAEKRAMREGNLTPDMLMGTNREDIPVEVGESPPGGEISQLEIAFGVVPPEEMRRNIVKGVDRGTPNERAQFIDKALASPGLVEAILQDQDVGGLTAAGFRGAMQDVRKQAGFQFR